MIAMPPSGSAAERLPRDLRVVSMILIDQNLVRGQVELPRPARPGLIQGKRELIHNLSEEGRIRNGLAR